MSEALKRLEFLIGKWKGRAEGQFGEKGIIDSIFECSHEPSEMFIATIGESRSNGKPVNKGASYLTWDANINKYVRKSMFSYGWINNEVGDFHNDRLTFDVVSMDGEPDYFKGLKWRSFIHRYSENEIGTGLEVSKQGGLFRLYGESKARRVQ
ncbi:MAG TPA: hypothetical protein VGS11_12030 [Candidatus Bathyarchaeia archaeon]|nr:hypothetical protein [Candidatus Bathyarchaeia archaeon]